MLSYHHLSRIFLSILQTMVEVTACLFLTFSVTELPSLRLSHLIARPFSQQLSKLRQPWPVHRSLLAAKYKTPKAGSLTWHHWPEKLATGWSLTTAPATQIWVTTLMCADLSIQHQTYHVQVGLLCETFFFLSY